MFPGFGRSKKNETAGETALNLSKQAGESPTGGGGGGGGGGVHGFDPTSLERAAKAAKELDKSKNSSGALKLIETQEVTKQKEFETERAKYQVMIVHIWLK